MPSPLVMGLPEARGGMPVWRLGARSWGVPALPVMGLPEARGGRLVVAGGSPIVGVCLHPRRWGSQKPGGRAGCGDCMPDRGGCLLLVPIWHRGYSSSEILFLVYGLGEDDNDSQAVCSRPAILLLLSWKGKDDIALCTAGGIHPVRDIVGNVHGGVRLILLAMWHSVDIHPISSFSIFQHRETDITLSITDTVQPLVILFQISR